MAQGYYTPQEAQSVFSQANEAYSREDYAAAREGYLKLLSHGFGGADVLYNLGTACLGQGDIGQAVLYLEKARRLSGNSPDIEANLSLAKSKQLDQVVGIQSEDSFWLRVAHATSQRAAGWIFLATWVSAFAVLFWARRIAGRTMAPILGALLLVLSLGAGAVLAAHAYVRESLTEAVVVAKTLPAREFPKEFGKVFFEVHSGLKVHVLEASGKFVKIRLPNGLEGWTEKEGISTI
ncbi:MAG TPA: SH3 domain-containing protein [Myxococcales bacterium]